MIIVHSFRPYRDIEFYWGVERDIDASESGKHISWAFLVEDLKPFRRSTWGCRLRLGTRGLHLGRCVRGEDPHHRLYSVKVDQISKWRGPDGHQARQEAAGDPDPGGEPVRPDEHGRPEPGPGGGPDECRPHLSDVSAASR